MPPARDYFLLSVLLVIPLSIAISASAQTKHVDVTSSKLSVAHHAMGQHLKAKGIPNFGQVTPTLYRGGQPSAEGFENLAHMGINIVVDTGRSKRDQTLIKNLGMAYVSLPWYCPFPKDEVFERFIEITRENPGTKVFVHCRLGDDRTGMMIAAYRMGEQGWTAKEAMQEMHEFGYRGMHHLMCPGLAGYEKSFPQRLQNNPVFENLR
jgi:tyrosine-protein phosphatase SIW14